MEETTEESLKWVINHVKFDLQESLICRRVYRDLITKDIDFTSIKDMYEKSARTQIQRSKNFKKLLKEYGE